MSSSRDTQYGVDTLTQCLRALKRKPNDSDSDDYIDVPTNRGQKLKKRSRFVRQGHLAPQNGPPLYREIVEHAGYRRAIISRNPPLIDEDGYAIDSEDDQNAVDEAQTNADVYNPWAGIRLDEIKAPLTSVTELATNPNWNRPYLSTGLDELCKDAQSMVKREKAAVETVKQLRKLLCGDLPFAPAGTMLGPHDDEMFDSSLSTQRLVDARRRALRRDIQRVASPKTNGESSMRPSVGPAANGTEEKAQVDREKRPEQRLDTSPADVTMDGTEAPKGGESASVGAKSAAPATNGTSSGGDRPQTKHGKDVNGTGDHPMPDSAIKEKKGAPEEISQSKIPKKTSEPSKDHPTDPPGVRRDKLEEAAPVPDGQAPSSEHHSKTDKGGAVAASTVATDAAPVASRAASVAGTDRAIAGPGDLDEGSLESLVDALFLIPRAARPHRDMGLPENEADDIRRLVQLYIHKQEEIDRGTQSLHQGLLWANARRREVLKWSKAEAHCGANRDMSDGEDWYDMEEWGLTEELKKGQDEEEEDNNTRDQPKKTRNRR